jgi:type IV fimbrial biogenesis protein FimT
MRHQRGFNLIEASVTLAVLALLTALMAPSVVDWLRGTQVRGVAEAAQNGLQKARMEALRRNQVVTLWLVSTATPGVLDNSCALASNSSAWVISVQDPSSLCATAPSPTTAPMIVESYAGTAASGITVAGLAADGATAATSVSFNGLGQTVQSGTPLARIDVTHSLTGARRLRVAISTSGAVRMCDQDVSSTDVRACPP